MPASSIIIGINKQGKELVSMIDLHLNNHENNFYENFILSSAMELKDSIQSLSIIKDGELYQSENVKTWFDSELYGKINRLRNVVDGKVDGDINVNIIISIFDKYSNTQLKVLLEAIKELKEEQQIADVNVKVFVVLYDINRSTNIQEINIHDELLALEQITDEYDSVIRDIYYLDDRNEERVVLNLSSEWLGFAISEFIVFQMICETSGAIMNKSKVFGLGVIHFNELLFRNVVTNTILQFKFKQEGVLDKNGAQLRDISKLCNPFIEKHQNFFTQFLEDFPFSEENSRALTSNSEKYISDFKDKLEELILSRSKTIGESKSLLANLLGESDKEIDGIDWEKERLNIADLEFDIIDYFNGFLNENERVDFFEQKKLKSKISDLIQGIKRDEKNLKKLEDQSFELRSDLNISFDEGIFSVDGQRINASGYIPSKISPSDEFYSYNKVDIPNSLDLSADFTKVKNQGELGSCTAFPITAVYEYYAKRNNKKVDISELFVYYNTRELNGNTDVEVGTSILDAIHSVREKGACTSKLHPYKIDAFMNKPVDEAYSEAQRQLVKSASRIEINENEFKNAIANGHPVIIGLKIFKSFYPKNKSGIIPFPSTNENSYDSHGNHALLIVGYNDEEKLFKLRNSWGEKFGDKGYCYAPYDYITDPEFCQEAFVITEIVDLSFAEFKIENNTSFNFLSDTIIRRKVIREYNLREKRRDLANAKQEHDELAYLNDVNAEKIKDPLFRKELFEKSESNLTQKPVQPAVSDIELKVNKNKPLLIIALGVIISIVSVLFTSFISLTGTLLGVVIGIVILLVGASQLAKKNKMLASENPISNDSKEKEMYTFETADALFEMFEDMNLSLLKRYKAMSSYHSAIKEWQLESEIALNKIEFDSPDFVINVVEKEPLLKYLVSEEKKFLQNLPCFTDMFYEKYKQNSDNQNEVFEELESYLSKDINVSIAEILDISIVDYIQGETKYAYFDSAPPLDGLINKTQKISMPFCNLKHSSKSLEIQNYVLHEQINSNEHGKLKEFARHRDAAIKPILTFRKDNSKKYVAIQVAPLDSIQSLVSYDL
ncbi:hypothetical protein ERX46_05350 [Brumimicrobium glaciale]|uniref:Peptidase C1A papain C-terminal domain-containing protein n=1 Tax=Brumimicrobium glaciale TaxID=200475 RepID=A0A4Q4KN13_9FLAO|nr:C1 family peptidase [Brumimicrobium glaciale]RYM34801.1 hypothetical protein ERX46_05350 [Brumimicrobium glaciale]